MPFNKKSPFELADFLPQPISLYIRRTWFLGYKKYLYKPFTIRTCSELDKWFSKRQAPEGGGLDVILERLGKGHVESYYKLVYFLIDGDKYFRHFLRFRKRIIKTDINQLTTSIGIFFYNPLSKLKKLGQKKSKDDVNLADSFLYLYDALRATYTFNEFLDLTLNQVSIEIQAAQRKTVYDEKKRVADIKLMTALRGKNG